LVSGFELLLKLNLLATYLALFHVSTIGASHSLQAGHSNSLSISRAQSPIAGIMSSDDPAANDVEVDAVRLEQAGADPLHEALEQLEPLRKLFSRIRMHKHDDFPSLLRMVNGNSTKIPPMEATAWTSKVQAWAAAHGAPGLLELVDAVVKISDDGNKFLPLFPDLPDADITDDWKVQRRALRVVANTRFGRHIGLSTLPNLANFSEMKTRTLFSGLSQMSSELSFRLQHAGSSPDHFLRSYSQPIRIPTTTPRGKFVRLWKALYGGKSSGALYAQEICSWLDSYGFETCSVDQTLFRLTKTKNGKESTLLITLYVNDGACCTNDEKLYTSAPSPTPTS
jgi:hypothetical protein